MSDHFNFNNYHFINGSIFEGLDEEEKEFLRKHRVRKVMKKNTLVLKEGAPPKGVYFIKKGKVKIFQTDKEGREQIVYFYTKGESFGYRALICSIDMPTSAKTIEDSVFSFLPSEPFIHLLQKSNKLAQTLLRSLSFEYAVWINTITAFTQKQVKERLALSLLILNEKYRKKSHPDKKPVINLSRADNASYIGTSVETLVRILHQFKTDKIITSKGRKIVIQKPEELVKIAKL